MKVLWDLEQLNQIVLSLNDQVFENVFSVGKVSDELQIIFQLVDLFFLSLNEILAIMNLNQQIGNVLLLTFWELVSFPVLGYQRD